MSARRDHLTRFQPKYPPELRARIRAEVAAGRSVRAIARETGVPQGTIYDWVRGRGRKRRTGPTAAGAAAAPRRRARDLVAGLRRSALDGLELADAQIALLRVELAQAPPHGADPERCMRLFAAYTAHVVKLTASVERTERLLAERARKQKKPDGHEQPRSLDEVRQEFARRLQAIYGTRDPPRFCE